MVDACTTVVGHCHDRSHHLTLMGKVMINRRVGDVNVLGKTQNDVRAYRSAITCPLSIYQSIYLSTYIDIYIYIRVWVCVDIAHITYLCVCILKPLQSHNIWQARGIFYMEPPPVARNSHPLPPSRCRNAAPKGCPGGPDRPPEGSRSCRAMVFSIVFFTPSCRLEKNRETNGFMCFTIQNLD